MAFENSINVSFTAEELQELNKAANTIKAIVLKQKVALTEQQRISFGRINGKKQYWLKKVHDYMKANPYMASIPADLDEHERDLNTLEAISPVINNLEPAVLSLIDITMLLGFDLFQNSNMYYKNLKAASRSGITDAISICEDLKQSFPFPPKINGVTKSISKAEGSLPFAIVMQ